jgi:hypothetical protein
MGPARTKHLGWEALPGVEILYDFANDFRPGQMR